MASKWQPRAVFLRTVRGALREHIKSSGQIPSLMCAVSEGSSPRKVKVSARLDMLGDGIDVRAYLQGEIAEQGSFYAAVGGLAGGRREFVLAVVSVEGAETWRASADPRRGLGGWARSGAEVAGGTGFIEKALREVPR